ncbi:MAG: hypothetical protein HFH68_05545 [Lachnospiraceae bacterium]|nr:hypothetical protein [Lachnospiraceae bacterium]
MKNNVFDGNKLINIIHMQKRGKPRIDMLIDAIAQADQAKDNYWRMYMRFDYIAEQYFHGDAVKCIPVITELENVFKEDPAAVERHKGDTLGKEAYVMAVIMGVDTIACLPQITLEQWDSMLDGLYSLVKQFGMAERSYYWQVFWRWMCIDLDKAEEYLQKAWNTVPDDRFDCESCEHAYAARLYLRMGQKEKADTYSEKVEKGILDDVCDDTFPSLWSFYLEYLLYHGDIKSAVPYARKLYKECNNDQGDLEHIGKVLQYYAYRNRTKGLNLFKKRLEWTNGIWNQKAKFYFYTGSWALFRELSKKQATAEMELPEEFAQWREDGIYETAVLADWFYKETEAIAESFDKRNGTGFYMDYLKHA